MLKISLTKKNWHFNLNYRMIESIIFKKLDLIEGIEVSIPMIKRELIESKE